MSKEQPLPHKVLQEQLDMSDRAMAPKWRECQLTGARERRGYKQHLGQARRKSFGGSRRPWDLSSVSSEGWRGRGGASLDQDCAV
jgi:hypothetical protein